MGIFPMARGRLTRMNRRPLERFVITSYSIHYTKLYDADKKVAIVRSYATEEILREYYPDIIPVLVDSSLEALKKVESGEAYASIEALGIVSYLIERHHLKHLKVVGETPYRYSYNFV